VKVVMPGGRSAAAGVYRQQQTAEPYWTASRSGSENAASRGTMSCRAGGYRLRWQIESRERGRPWGRASVDFNASRALA
jgi:hypothetical protein